MIKFILNHISTLEIIACIIFYIFRNIFISMLFFYFIVTIVFYVRLSVKDARSFQNYQYMFADEKCYHLLVIIFNVLIRHVQTNPLSSTKKITLTLNNIVIREGDFFLLNSEVGEMMTLFIFDKRNVCIQISSVLSHNGSFWLYRYK